MPPTAGGEGMTGNRPPPVGQPSTPDAGEHGHPQPNTVGPGPTIMRRPEAVPRPSPLRGSPPSRAGTPTPSLPFVRPQPGKPTNRPQPVRHQGVDTSPPLQG